MPTPTATANATTTTRPVRPWFVVAIVPFLLAGLVALLGVVDVAIGAFRSVWVVNGSGRTYHVVIDGEREDGGKQTRLAPGQRERINGVGDGDHTVKVSGEGLRETRVTFTMASTFMTRIFEGKRTFILNPDRAAVLTLETNEYVDTRTRDLDSADYGWIALPRQLLHDVNVDYEFAPFPDEIRLQRNARAEKRKRVEIAEGGLAGALALVAGPEPSEGVRRDAQLALLRARLEFDATDDAAIVALVELDPEDPALATLLEPHVDDRPTRVELWVAWLNAIEVEQHAGGLERLRRNVDACGHYVLSIFGERDQRPAERATAAAGGCAYAQVPQARRLFIDGDVEGARALLAQAEAGVMKPGMVPWLQEHWRDLLILTDNGGLWLKHQIRAQVAGDRESALRLAYDSIDVAAVDGDDARIDTLHAEFLKRDDEETKRAVKTGGDAVEAVKARVSRKQRIDVAAAYGKRDYDALVKLAPDYADTKLAFELALIAGDYDAVADIIEGESDVPSEWHLLGLAAAYRHPWNAGQRAAAAASAIDAYEREENAAVAALIRRSSVDGQRPSLAEARASVEHWSDAAALFAYLAERFPKHDEYRIEAVRLAQLHHPPTLFVRTRR